MPYIVLSLGPTIMAPTNASQMAGRRVGMTCDSVIVIEKGAECRSQGDKEPLWWANGGARK